MKYIMIQNQGELTERGIRLLGESKKSEDAIGQFGTGLKEAIALSLRLDAQIIIFCGEHRVDFSISDGEIFYNGQPMNLATGFGSKDWTDPWFVLRETVCNAKDEGGLHLEVTDTLSGVAGATRVYIEATFEMLEAYSELELKLLFLTKRRRLHPGLYRGEGRCYVKGVYVGAIPGVFDYDLNFSISESRQLSHFEALTKISEFWASVKDEELQVELIKMWGDYNGNIENQCWYAYNGRLNPTWRETFRKYWPNTIVTSSGAITVMDAKESGHEVYMIPDEHIRSVLMRSGFPTSDPGSGFVYDYLSDRITIYGRVMGEMRVTNKATGLTVEDRRSVVKDGVVFVNYNPYIAAAELQYGCKGDVLMNTLVRKDHERGH